MNTAIIVAAGQGTRMGDNACPKQFLCVEGMPILAHTLKRWDSFQAIDRIVLVTRPEAQTTCQQLITQYGIQKITAVVDGGQERQDSVFRGLQQVPPGTEIVLIHDAVRMFVTEKLIEHSIQAARTYGASIVAVPVKDTIKQAGAYPPNSSQHNPADDKNGFYVVKTLERSTLWQVQTPQTFQYSLLLNIYHQAQQEGIQGTDDATLAEYFGYPVRIIPGSYRNIKITTPDDLLIARAFLTMSNEQ